MHITYESAEELATMGWKSSSSSSLSSFARLFFLRWMGLVAGLAMGLKRCERGTEEGNVALEGE